MEFTNGYSTAVLALAVVLLLLRFFVGGKKNIRLPPSPKGIPFFGHLHLLDKPFHATLSRLAVRHGPVFSLRLGSRSAVVVSSPACARECFTEHDVTFAGRPNLPSLTLISKDYGSVLSVLSHGPQWRALRLVAAVHLLSAHRVSCMAGVISAEVRAMMVRLRRSAVASPRVQLRRRIFELSLSVLMETIADTKTTLASSSNVDYSEAGTDMSMEAREFKKEADAINEYLGTTNLWDYLPFLEWFDMSGAKKKVLAAMGRQDAFMQQLIDSERRKMDHADADANGGEKKSMISVLLSLQKKEPEVYTDKMIIGLCLNLFTAGTGTSSITVEWAMSLLLNHPAVLKKAQAEIEASVGTSRLVTAEDVPYLTYLRCIINETLRLYPPVPMLLPHQSTADSKVGGYHVPKDTMLMVNAYAVHRDPTMWENPDEFRPERFEDGKAEGLLLMPFGMGRRKCPGEAMALRLVGLVLAALIQCFDWERVDGAQVDMTEGEGISFSAPKAVPFEAICKPRTAMSDVL
uniref:Uncharacterized protein n=1 Tax=Avena sativa TaxID=4498 RepID=A0ACD5XCG5_AVESA